MASESSGGFGIGTIIFILIAGNFLFCDDDDDKKELKITPQAQIEVTTNPKPKSQEVKKIITSVKKMAKEIKTEAKDIIESTDWNEVKSEITGGIKKPKTEGDQIDTTQDKQEEKEKDIIANQDKETDTEETDNKTTPEKDDGMVKLW